MNLSSWFGGASQIISALSIPALLAGLFEWRRTRKKLAAQIARAGITDAAEVTATAITLLGPTREQVTYLQSELSIAYKEVRTARAEASDARKEIAKLRDEVASLRRQLDVIAVQQTVAEAHSWRDDSTPTVEE